MTLFKNIIYLKLGLRILKIQTFFFHKQINIAGQVGFKVAKNRKQ